MDVRPDGESKMDEIFTDRSPFGDEQLETVQGFPQAYEIPTLPPAPQEFSPNLEGQMGAEGKGVPSSMQPGSARRASTAA